MILPEPGALWGALPASAMARSAAWSSRYPGYPRACGSHADSHPNSDTPAHAGIRDSDDRRQNGRPRVAPRPGRTLRPGDRCDPIGDLATATLLPVSRLAHGA